MSAARDQEYAELLGRLPELRQELAEERSHGNTTYAEVEESEADLERFRSWLAKIMARDYFDAPRSREACAAVDCAAAELAAFEEAALHAGLHWTCWHPNHTRAWLTAGREPVVTGSLWWDAVIGVACAF